jgi:hypothetical protein
MRALEKTGCGIGAATRADAVDQRAQFEFFSARDGAAISSEAAQAGTACEVLKRMFRKRLVIVCDSHIQ